jgi:hypothetical protein
MKGTDHIDKNGEGIFVILVDVPLWGIDKVKSIFKHVVKKYHPLDVFFGSVVGLTVLVIATIAVVYQILPLMIVIGVLAVIGLMVYGVSRWYQFIHSKSKEYKSE